MNKLQKAIQFAFKNASANADELKAIMDQLNFRVPDNRPRRRYKSERKEYYMNLLNK
jgi:hypothetical protein